LVVPIEDEFPALAEEQSVGLTDEWVRSLRRDDEPLELDVTAAELVAEARAEMGW
jgi:hypothetical protein